MPHVPHMTTITPSIVPTEALTHWRAEHPERYPFVLSDSSPSPDRSSFDPSCIRSRKAWLIDHTVYVSSRSEGTRSLQSPTPKELHEMQWSSEYGYKGRLVEEREISISPPRTADTTSTSAWSNKYDSSISEGTVLTRLMRKLNRTKEKPETDHRPHSWLRDAGQFLKDRKLDTESIPVPLPDGCNIPNAIFARKHGLVDAGHSLPLRVWTSQLPTAESKATDTIVEAARDGLLASSSSWSFRGPFTPQLGFDGGLDYQWGVLEPTITIRRFDVAPYRTAVGRPTHSSPEKGNRARARGSSTDQQDSSKRQGIVFVIDNLFTLRNDSSIRNLASGSSRVPYEDESNTGAAPTADLISPPSRILRSISEGETPETEK